MTAIIPKSRPKATRSDVLKYVDDSGCGLNLNNSPVLIVGVRGYYKRTMGDPYRNDRNLYDDAIFILAPNEFHAYNANVDPSTYRKGIATLVPGVYDVVKWRHKGKYAALQIVKDTVARDGQTKLDTGRHGINFHYGGSYTTTGSEGCMTFPRPQFWQFQGHVYELMDHYGLSRAKFLLVAEK